MLPGDAEDAEDAVDAEDVEDAEMREERPAGGKLLKPELSEIEIVVHPNLHHLHGFECHEQNTMTGW